jgi:hypothetical protein
MVEPLDSLAMSVYHLPGVYALLLGSGVSNSAGIPTAEQLTLHRIREIAAVKGEDPGADPKKWYFETYGVNPDYSNVFEEAVKSQDERSEVLRPLFELTRKEIEEGQEGLKVPTKAHQRIANLIAAGYIRVVLTTNFDTLLEQALDSVHTSYQVIRSAIGIADVLPLAHAKCTIVKLHGDYRDANIRNTVEEVSVYDSAMNKLLLQVLEEYGLIVCGWSAETDKALSDAIMNCPTQRFSTYWVVRKQARDSVKPLIEQRKAHIVSTTDADTFFTELEEKVLALKNIEAVPPPTAKMASATVKRYLRSSDHIIDLNDFVMKQVEQLQRDVSFANLVSGLASSAELNRLVRHYEEATKIVQAIMITGSRWSQREHDDIWVECLYRVASTNSFLERVMNIHNQKD